MKISLWLTNEPYEERNGEWFMAARVFTEVIFLSGKRAIPAEKWYFSVPAATGEIVVEVDHLEPTDGRFEGSDGRESPYSGSWILASIDSAIDRLETLMPDLTPDHRAMYSKRILKLCQENG